VKKNYQTRAVAAPGLGPPARRRTARPSQPSPPPVRRMVRRQSPAMTTTPASASERADARLAAI